MCRLPGSDQEGDTGLLLQMLQDDRQQWVFCWSCRLRPHLWASSLPDLLPHPAGLCRELPRQWPGCPALQRRCLQQPGPLCFRICALLQNPRGGAAHKPWASCLSTMRPGAHREAAQAQCSHTMREQELTAAGTTREQPLAPADQQRMKTAGGEVPRALFARGLELAWDCSPQAFIFPAPLPTAFRAGERSPNPSRLSCWARKKTLNLASGQLHPGICLSRGESSTCTPCSPGNCPLPGSASWKICPVETICLQSVSTKGREQGPPA